ncbi:NAD(P)-dependent oxidoreductase [Pararhodobacter marinus]|uniref:Hydroxyacid dehydrogenase n=1 Tax=Pararhodobacter marinus TaxID=2184063 RepID=A0A2U2CHX0_9RHOB|nr:NAD(P)-dependent oxidoreductase [Pararhodobacter marinus]PWE31480.1 hydroxyacid dehydrogenase [Pararhodobacter marinus]
MSEAPCILVLNRIAHPLVRDLMPGAEFLVVPAAPDPQIPPGAESRISAIMARLPGEVRAETIAHLPKLRVISAAGVGLQNIDIPAATRAGVVVVNHPGHGFLSVAEHAVGLMLALSRRIVEIDGRLRSDGWRARDHFLDRVSDRYGTVLFGQRLGIAGLGHVGLHTARICRLGLGMDVSAFSPSVAESVFQEHGIRRAATMADLCATADVLLLAAAYRAGRPPLLGTAELAVMKPTAILINVARGGLVDQPALVDALRTGQLAGAGLDVFDPEPPPADCPFRDMENVVVTPHVAGPSLYSALGLARSNAEQVFAVLAGRRPPHVVNPEVYDRA